MSQTYEQAFPVRWADLDPNRHLRHTAFNDYATHVRFSCLAERGFGAERFEAANVGPVIFREETRYRREVAMGETITIDFRVAGLSANGRKYRLTHRVLRADGELAATVTVEGAWLDLTTRRIRRPPPALLAALRSIARSEDFEELGS
ncbi:MAG: thioesterase family protein [Acidobacteriota bacterium]